MEAANQLRSRQSKKRPRKKAAGDKMFLVASLRHTTTVHRKNAFHHGGGCLSVEICKVIFIMCVNTAPGNLTIFCKVPQQMRLTHVQQEFKHRYARRVMGIAAIDMAQRLTKSNCHVSLSFLILQTEAATSVLTIFHCW